MPLSLAGAIILNMAVLIFITIDTVVIKDTEADVWLRTDFGRKSTLDEADFIGNGALMLPRFQFFLSRLLIIRSL